MSDDNVLKWQDNSPNWANRWINIKDRLPDKRQTILFAVKNKVHIGNMTSRLTNGNWLWVSYIPAIDKHLTNDDISHWMPLPEPPSHD